MSTTTQEAPVSKFHRRVNEIKLRPDWREPAAYGIGLATYTDNGRLLDVRYLAVNLASDGHSGVAALLFSLGMPGHTTRLLTDDDHIELMDYLAEFRKDPLDKHPNLRALETSRQAIKAKPSTIGGQREVIMTFIDDLGAKPASAEDVWLRLHLLSLRKAKPNELNLEGAFDLLANVAWTNHGPVAADELEAKRYALLVSTGEALRVTSQDKFPPYLDYMGNEDSKDIRISDGARVRLGAYLSPGTTVMPAGFVNFNAGTLGPAMVEGRISAGVVIGAGTDIGGSAGILGTLSGGNSTVISTGERCLLGANSELGISLGDDCILQAGLSLMAGVTVHDYREATEPERLPKRRKARDLSGQSGMFIHQHDGYIQVLNNNRTAELNAALHGGVIPEPTAD